MSRLDFIKWLDSMSFEVHNDFVELVQLAGFPSSNLCRASIGAANSSILQWWESPIGYGDLNSLVAIGNLAIICNMLYNVPKPQFENILFALNMPKHIRVGENAPQIDRVKNFIQWVYQNQLLDKTILVIEAIGIDIRDRLFVVS